MPVMTTIERRPKSDQTLRLAVVSELKWTPNVDARAIGVAVIDGVVTLTGHVQTSSEMVSVERAVLRIPDVNALVNEINVHPECAPRDTD
jgi:osmotically-inducible protein OsmY